VFINDSSSRHEQTGRRRGWKTREDEHQLLLLKLILDQSPERPGERH
jgi:hypothetical protein